MTGYHTIQLSEAAYTLLLQQAVRLQAPLEQVLEGLVSNNLSVSVLEEYNGDATLALAAVQRLSMLFAEVAIPDFDQIVNDPMFALANMDVLE